MLSRPMSMLLSTCTMYFGAYWLSGVMERAMARSGVTVGEAGMGVPSGEGTAVGEGVDAIVGKGVAVTDATGVSVGCAVPGKMNE
jgi:hypothetical protein